MTSKVISYSKVDDVTRILTKSYDVKQEKIKADMSKALAAECAKHLPAEVMDFYKKYPNKVHNHGSVTFKHADEYFYLDLRIPTLEMDVMKKIVTPTSNIFATLTQFAQDYLVHKLEKNTIKNQIKCTLIKLRTYKRIEANFPEAYDILLYQIDKEVKQPKGLCDSVEELRAKLSKELAK